MSYGYYDYSYVSVGEKLAKARKYAEKLAKKGIVLDPIEEGTKLNATWWGRFWNTTMESSASLSNRLSRGKSYIRNGFVLDLKIEEGKVEALVAGSTSKPYSVTIYIKPLEKKEQERIKELLGERIDSVEALMAGRLPKDLNAEFQNLLFPKAKDFRYTCSCPDGAYLCKHVAAAMYGISVKLDHDPILFFKLRGMDYRTLIKSSLEDRTQRLLKNASKKSDRELDEESTRRLFGI